MQDARTMNDQPAAPAAPATPAAWAAKGALSHIRVLDLSRVFAGPWAAQMLADLGAEVVKVERPHDGDDARRLGPPFLRDDEGQATRESGFFMSANRNKKSVTVDLAKPEGQAIVRALAQKADVLIENYKVGDLARHGLDEATLRALNPRLVYCSITGFGQTGPYRARAGYDSIFQGMGGLMAITGHADSAPGGGPQKVGLIVSDLMAGMYATVAILAALEHRDAVSGMGQFIDLALLDSQVAALSHVGMGHLVSGEPLARCGTQSPTAAPSQMYRCRDGAVMLVVGNKAQWGKLCAVMGRPALAADARFATNPDRIGHRAELNTILEPIFLAQPRQHWIDAFAEAGIPCGPVNELPEVFEDPQVRSRGMVVHLPHPQRAALPMLANPIRLSETPVQYRSVPPALGEHTDEVLSALGYDEAARAGLRARGVV
jgi:crotonobetainyl-CoA:carnitine CoA-transferase CaiB-like acyl-CoA transferase